MDSPSPPAGTGVTRSSWAMAVLGLLTVAYLAWTVDFSSIVDTFVAIGYWFAVLAALRLSVIGIMACGWHSLLGRNTPFLKTFRARWIGESINNLLPVAQVGGDVVRARLVRRTTETWHHAAASVAADMTWNLVGQAVLASIGAWQMAAKVHDLPLMWVVLIAGALPVVAIGCAQRPGALRRLARWLDRSFNREHVTTEQSAELFSRALAAIYARPRATILAIVCHLVAACGRTMEVWLILHLAGHDVTALDAIMIEGLSGALRTALFFLPAGLGAQEGALMLLCSWAGVPPAAGLALALAKRARELVVNGVGLSVWIGGPARRL